MWHTPRCVKRGWAVLRKSLIGAPASVFYQAAHWTSCELHNGSIVAGGKTQRSPIQEPWSQPGEGVNEKQKY